MPLSAPLTAFFWVELRNQDQLQQEAFDQGEEDLLLPPADLDTASASWWQAPGDVLASWCDLGEYSPGPLPFQLQSILAATRDELQTLVATRGGATELLTLLRETGDPDAR